MFNFFIWIKRLFFLALIFFGLYYFGDFRINDHNVRDTLQRWIPPEKLNFAKDKAWNWAKLAYERVEVNFKGEKGEPSESFSKTSLTEVTKAMDHISEEDQKKLKQLLKEHLEVDIGVESDGTSVRKGSP